MDLRKIVKDITGRKFAYLTVVSFNSIVKCRTLWNVTCVCGKELVLRGDHLQRKLGPIPQSCGCKLTEIRIKTNTIHGLSKHPLYKTWISMIARCHSEKDKDFHNYGGRGIRVCDDWRRSRQTFINDMFPTYKKGLTLDRINNELGYFPENCRWATQKEQSNNRRTNVIIQTKWGLKTIVEASELSGINRGVIYQRIKARWREEDLLKPTEKRKSSPVGK